MASEWPCCWLCDWADLNIDWEAIACGALWVQVTGGNFHLFFKCHWQSPCTALTAGKCLPLGLCKETVKESRPGQNTTGSGLSDAHLEVFIPGASREWFPRFPALACTGDHVGTSHTCDKAEKTRVEWPAWIWRGLAAEMKNELQKKSTEQTWPRVLTSVGFLYLEYVEIQLCETKP